jgi:hypothetical protein
MRRYVPTSSRSASDPGSLAMAAPRQFPYPPLAAQQSAEQSFRCITGMPSESAARATNLYPSDNRAPPRPRATSS